jgi:hypothetical protein
MDRCDRTKNRHDIAEILLKVALNTINQPELKTKGEVINPYSYLLTRELIQLSPLQVHMTSPKEVITMHHLTWKVCPSL